MTRQPSFLFIGPDKTGSTWAYNILRAHPHCFVPAAKDLYFFDRYYHKGLEWYFGFFDGATQDHLAVGELSHDYLFSVQAAKHIAKDLPNVTLLSFLRHPAERTFSHYLYLRRNGLTQAPFEEALETCPELIRNSRYGEHLEVYFSLFAKEQIKIFFYDQMQADARAFAASMLRAIGLPELDDYDYEKPVLSAAQPRSVLAAKAMQRGAKIARDMGLAGLVGRVKSSVLSDVLFKPYELGAKPEMARETRQRLNAVFEADIGRLEGMLDTSLDHWRV